MKKIVAFVLALGLLPASGFAAVSFYRAPNGQLVLEATDCQSISRIADIANFPDDPPTTEEEEEEEKSSTGQTTKQVSPDIAGGVQTILSAVLAKEEVPQRTKSFEDISEEEISRLEAADFYERQESFMTFVREVNWKTGLQITWRDFSFFRRLKMACSGVSQLTKPIRVGLDAYVGDLDSVIETASDQGVNKLAQAVRGHSFSAMTKLSVVGMVDAIAQKNPFLLLTLDEDTYNKLVETEPKIADLFEDMYVFFAIRAVRMDSEFDVNTEDLIRVSKIGKGDAFNTWKVLAEYAKKMLELSRDGKLSVDDEKEIHIWKLESSMHYIKEQVRIEKRAAELAAKDPQNSAILEEIKQGPKKKPSLDDKARALLQRSTEDEIKKLIRKYVNK